MATAAGVSKSTVSQFLNGRFDYMSKETKERIQQTVERLNYVPNSIARSLKTDKTRTIGVIVRDVAGFYTSQAIRGMDDYCKANHYNLIIYNTDFDSTIEANALTSLKHLRVDGLILTSSGANNELIKQLSTQETPVVQFQIEHDEYEKSIILSDYKQAAFEATEYLIQLGHKRIGFFTQEFEGVKSRKERIEGYNDALTKYGITFDESLVYFWHRETGMQQRPEQILKQNNPPTALFTQHLAITTDVLKDLCSANLSIPDDVSLIGFDDLPMAEFFKVPITVIKQDSYRIGSQTAKVLIDQLTKVDTGVKRIRVPCELIKRDSCKKIEQSV